jgi:hypothetical protein
MLLLKDVNEEYSLRKTLLQSRKWSQIRYIGLRSAYAQNRKKTMERIDLLFFEQYFNPTGIIPVFLCIQEDPEISFGSNLRWWSFRC